MAKGGKLTKMLKKVQSIGRHRPATPRANVEASALPVYVGRARRRYLVGQDVVDHPLFQELVERDHGSDEIVVACEVLLFEHLLWMLENGDPQPDSLDELVGYYACS